MTLLAELFCVARLAVRGQGTEAGEIPVIAREVRSLVAFRKERNEIPVAGLTRIACLLIVVARVARDHGRHVFRA